MDEVVEFAHLHGSNFLSHIDIHEPTFKHALLYACAHAVLFSLVRCQHLAVVGMVFASWHHTTFFEPMQNRPRTPLTPRSAGRTFGVRLSHLRIPVGIHKAGHAALRLRDADFEPRAVVVVRVSWSLVPAGDAGD